MTTTSIKRIEELRKLQLTGGSTYTISLPKTWILQNQLKKKSSLRIRLEDDGSLSVRSSELPKKETSHEAYIQVSQKEDADALVRKTVSAYLVLQFCRAVNGA